VTQAQETAGAVEAARVATMHDTEASAQEVTTAWESVVALVKDAEDQAVLAKRETRERESRVEAENARALASIHGEVEGFASRIGLLEGEPAEVC
jgi:hypothetical protein